MKVFDMGRNSIHLPEQPLLEMDPTPPRDAFSEFIKRVRFYEAGWLPTNTWLMISGPINEERLKAIANGK